MFFFSDDIWRKLKPQIYRYHESDAPAGAQELINDALNTDISRSSIRRRTDNLGSSEKEDEFVEVNLDGTERDKKLIEDMFEGTERDEKLIEDKFDAIEKDEKLIADIFDAIEKDEQPIEEKLKKTTDAKLFVFDWTTRICGFFVPLVTIQMGFNNLDKCPANLYIPCMVILIGLLNFLTAGYICLKTNSKNFYCLEQEERKTIIKFSVLLACVWIIQCIQFLSMEVSFDSSAHNYCRNSFYIFTIAMNTLVALAYIIGLALWFYDPGFLNRDSDDTPPAYRLLPFESD